MLYHQPQHRGEPANLISTDKGEVYHSGAWPEDFDPKGKKIGLIGAGATAVQITQKLGKAAEELTVFVRRPSNCLAMKQKPMTPEEQHNFKAFYPALFKAGRASRAGFPAEPRPEGVLEVSAAERETWLDEMWERGGFHFALSGFADNAINPEANEIIYQIWRKKICARLTDPKKNRIMAPEKKPYYFGTKRTPLEQDYYVRKLEIAMGRCVSPVSGVPSDGKFRPTACSGQPP